MISDRSDPLIIFFGSLLDSKIEIEILTMILKDYDEVEIIEKMINYKEEKGNSSAEI